MSDTTFSGAFNDIELTDDTQPAPRLPVALGGSVIAVISVALWLDAWQAAAFVGHTLVTLL